jgi:hypothetical protein
LARPFLTLFSHARLGEGLKGTAFGGAIKNWFFLENAGCKKIDNVV